MSVSIERFYNRLIYMCRKLAHVLLIRLETLFIDGHIYVRSNTLFDFRGKSPCTTSCRPSLVVVVPVNTREEIGERLKSS